MIQGFQLFDSSIDIVLTLIDFGQDITILKMAIFDKVDYIEIEPALAMTVVNTLVVFYTNIGSPFDCQTEMFLRGSIWECYSPNSQSPNEIEYEAQRLVL